MTNMLSFFIRTQRSLAAALFISCATLFVAILHEARAQPTQAQPMLPTLRLTAGMHVITAELATTPATQETGLMFRKELGPNHGMLFAYAKPGPLCFWMMNTLVPLSIAFMRDDGTIVNIADMQPMTVNSHCSAEPVRFALEMEQGWFAKRGITSGKQIIGLPK